MRLGVHLPVVDFGGGLPTAAALRDYVRAARDAGFDAVAANDHLRWRRPWLDGLGALAAAAADAGGMTLATHGRAARRPPPGGPRGRAHEPGHAAPRSGRRGHRARVRPRRLRRRRHPVRGGAGPGSTRPPGTCVLLLSDTGPPLWYGSWGSPARLRALAADADGWIASGYNARPADYATARATLDGHLRAAGRDPAGFPDMIATVWLQVTDSAAEADRILRDVLGPALGRDPGDLGHLPVGPPEHCIRVLADYAAAGAQRVMLWPVSDGLGQLRRCAEEIAPHLPRLVH